MADPDEKPEETRERLANLGEIAAEVAHELRNVLQIISASAYLARLDPPGSLPHVQKIERHARLAHAIVDDLMSLARGEAAHAGPIAVAEIVEAARAELEPTAAIWTDDLAPADLKARAHPGLTTRVLHVLYENAIHVCAPRRPTIVTQARSEAGRVLIEVRDDGPGVPPDIAADIFDPLVTGRPGGSGLGLALAKRIVLAHGGSIALAPPAPGVKGATFRFDLPGK